LSLWCGFALVVVGWDGWVAIFNGAESGKYFQLYMYMYVYILESSGRPSGGLNFIWHQNK
jgi:hypothetical protein